MWYTVTNCPSGATCPVATSTHPTSIIICGENVIFFVFYFASARNFGWHCFIHVFCRFLDGVVKHKASARKLGTDEVVIWGWRVWDKTRLSSLGVGNQTKIKSTGRNTNLNLVELVLARSLKQKGTDGYFRRSLFSRARRLFPMSFWHRPGSCGNAREAANYPLEFLSDSRFSFARFLHYFTAKLSR